MPAGFCPSFFSHWTQTLLKIRKRNDLSLKKKMLNLYVLYCIKNFLNQNNFFYTKKLIAGKSLVIFSIQFFGSKKSI